MNCSVVDDRSNPVFLIPFFKSAKRKGVPRTDRAARTAINNVNRFHAHLVNAMRSAKGEASSALAAVLHSAKKEISSSPAAVSNASEPQKLWELKQAGALTDQEFAAQKALLLGAGSPVQTL